MLAAGMKPIALLVNASATQIGQYNVSAALWDFAWSRCRTPQLVGGDTRRTQTSSGLRYTTHANSQRPVSACPAASGLTLPVIVSHLTFFKNVIYYGRNPPGDSISGPTPTRKGGSSLYSAKGIPVQRVIAYIDGYNLYYGLRTKRWKWFYWLNVQSMARLLLKPHQTLVSTKYFTTIVKHPPDKQRRQAVFLEALQTLNDFQIFYGHWLSNPITCRQCGHTYEGYHEKMTDVNIAVELMCDAFQDHLDTALLISADSDLVGPVKAMRRLFPQKRVVVAFPPARFSGALKAAAHAHTFIGPNVLSNSVFPDQVVKPEGFVLHRPAEWR